jgi:hypothetical protein
VGKMSEIKTVSVEKDTWILELPEELCSREGFAVGTLASLTVKNGAIQGSFIRPSQKPRKSIERFTSILTNTTEPTDAELKDLMTEVKNTAKSKAFLAQEHLAKTVNLEIAKVQQRLKVK